MAAVAASLCSTLLFVAVFEFVSAEQKTITAESGQNVTLTCRAPNNNNIILGVEWSRADLENEKYVLFYRDNKPDPENQHPSFKNRVDLQDRQMKDGDVSLILKNVTINDTGTYECRVVQKGTNRRKRAILDNEPISIIYLRVVAPPGSSEGSLGLIVGVSVSVVLVVAAVVLGIFIKRKHKKQQSQDSYQRPTEQQLG